MKTQEEELRERLATLNGSGGHACYCPRSVDGGCRCSLKDEYVDEIVSLIKAELSSQREDLEAKHKESYETVIGSPVELRGDIDDELREYVPDIKNRSVDGISPSFTFLYTRAIINSVQEAQRKRAAQLTKSNKGEDGE